MALKSGRYFVPVRVRTNKSWQPENRTAATVAEHAQANLAPGVWCWGEVARRRDTGASIIDVKTLTALSSHANQGARKTTYRSVTLYTPSQTGRK
jgi:hypothetical protein